MTKEEPRELISKLLEEKLRELIGDPDEGLIVRKAMRDRLSKREGTAWRRFTEESQEMPGSAYSTASRAPG
jgi:hypothetical protein